MIPRRQFLRLRVCQDLLATRRSFSSGGRALQTNSATDDSAAPEAAPNSRWLADIRSRLAVGVGNSKPKNETQRKRGERLKTHIRLLDQNWLDLSAGREGYLSDPQWRGLDQHSVAWGEMDSMVSHVNNIMYNRFAESGRVNWIMNVAARIKEPENRREFIDLMSPRRIGLILASIRTDYKFPMTFPDQVTVLHKLVNKPDNNTDRILMEAVAYSHKNRRLAARFFEDIAVYDYQAGERAPLKPFMVEEMVKMYELQEQRRQQTEKQVQDLLQVMQKEGV